MFFRKASFIFAASFAQSALGQVSPSQLAEGANAPSQSQARSDPENTSFRIVEPVDTASSRVGLPVPAFGADTTPTLGTATPTINPDGPYFLQNVAGNRRQRGYEPLPHRFGSFIFSPSIAVRSRADDNWTARGQSLPLLTVIGTATVSLADQFGIALPPEVISAAVAQAINPKLASVGDIAVDLAPSFALSSDWSRNAVTLDASARITRFARLDRLNRDEFRVGSRGRLDIGTDGRLSTRLGFVRQSEPAGSNGLAVLDFFGFGPSLVDRFTVGADIGTKSGRFGVVLDAEYAQDRYLPLKLSVADLIAPALLPLQGVPERLTVSQAYRNRSQFDLRVRLSYSVGGDFDVFLVPTFGKIRQAGQADLPVGNATFASDTFGALAGVRKDFGHLVVVQAGLRYQDRNYVSPLFVRSRRFDVEGAVDWYPTPLLSFRVNAAQQFRGSGILGQADISTRTVGVRADYEVLRNVGLQVEGNASWDQFPAALGALQPTVRSARQDAAVRVSWNIGRSTEVNFSAGGHRRRAGNSIFLGNFAASRFSLSLTRRI